MNCIKNFEDFSIKNPEKKALIWDNYSISYGELNKLTNKFANFLNSFASSKERIAIFLPRSLEVYYSFIGTLKSGRIVTTLFQALNEKALEIRLKRGKIKTVITNSDLAKRINKKKISCLKNIIKVDSQKFKKNMDSASEDFKLVQVKDNHTSIMLFTSSTAGTPIAGIMLPHISIKRQIDTAKNILQLKPERVYFCTADPGWITGAVYGILAPLSIGATIVFAPERFSPDYWYSLIEKNKVEIIYTAPTALRMLSSSNAHKKYDLSSLKYIFSVGEALNIPTYKWFKENLKIEVYDTYWQTETGSIMIANIPGKKIKPGSMGKPYKINAFVLDNKLKPSKTNEGMLAFKYPWNSMMTSIFQNPKMYRSYFKKGYFITNDLVKKDKEGYFFFLGRVDDIIKTSGERVSPIEVESVLMEFPNIKEVAVIGKPHPIYGEIIKAFIVLKKPKQKPEFEKIKKFMKSKLAAHAYPKEIEFIKKLPKTKSGKIIRKLLKEN